jgi:hypothetical protein
MTRFVDIRDAIAQLREDVSEDWVNGYPNPQAVSAICGFTVSARELNKFQRRRQTETGSVSPALVETKAAVTPEPKGAVRTAPQRATITSHMEELHAALAHAEEKLTTDRNRYAALTREVKAARGRLADAICRCKSVVEVRKISPPSTSRRWPLTAPTNWPLLRAASRRLCRVAPVQVISIGRYSAAKRESTMPRGRGSLPAIAEERCLPAHAEGGCDGTALFQRRGIDRGAGKRP